MAGDQRTPVRNPGFSRRDFLRASGVATAGALVLAACGSGDDTTTTAAAAATTAPTEEMALPMATRGPVTVGYNNPNRLLRSPLFIGQSLGYFEEVGIVIEEVNDADDPLPPTIAGSFDLALFDSDVLFDAEDKSTAAGEPIGLRMLNINLGGQPLIMGSNPEFPDGESLRGARVGGAREGTTNEGLAKFMLQEMGLDWETDVEFTNLTGGSNDWVQAMLTGQVDATIMFTRHIPVVEGEGGNTLFNDTLDAPQGGFGMLTSKVEEDPGFPAAWAHAYIKAQRFVKDPANAEEVGRILNEDHGIDLPEAFAIVYEADAGILTQDLGFDPDAMQSWLEFLAPFGNVRADIPWRDYMNLDGLWVAQDALGLTMNPNETITEGEELIANF